MDRISIKNVELEGVTYDNLYVFLDDEGTVILLPLLWTVHLACKSTVHVWRIKGSFDRSAAGAARRKPEKVTKVLKEEDISENTVKNYIGHVYRFLVYINNLHKSHHTPSVHHTELIYTKFVNNYLNQVLPDQLQSSESLKAHQAAISAYYSFLFSLELSDSIESTIYATTKQYMAEKDASPQKINYVSRVERRMLLNACSSDRDKLILRMGYEVGLRTEENTGLVLGQHKAKLKYQKGLLALFDELNRSPDKLVFEFELNGRYTKGGKTRTIYFDRDLLEAMEHYYENERAKVIKRSGRECETLFVRNDNEGKGLPIAAEKGSNLFHDLKMQFPHMNQALAYHDLRHTFATELYHSQIYDENGREKGSQKDALVQVQLRLGHSSERTTKRYIRMAIQMSQIEGWN